ncbi:MAG: EamA family transporter [Lachnospiraceae bacterium]|nr:EamA family transporter [Lachnospiraceae bacterium]
MNINPYYLLMLASVVIASFAQILLKKSAQKKYTSMIREYLNIFVIAGYGLMVLGMLFNLVAYKFIDYKNGPVIESLGFLFVMILSYFFFQEKITKKKVIGNLIILAGVAFFYL